MIADQPLEVRLPVYLEHALGDPLGVGIGASAAPGRRDDANQIAHVVAACAGRRDRLRR